VNAKLIALLLVGGLLPGAGTIKITSAAENRGAEIILINGWIQRSS
jgi:hypothetical protein